MLSISDIVEASTRDCQEDFESGEKTSPEVRALPAASQRPSEREQALFFEQLPSQTLKELAACVEGMERAARH